MADKVTTTPTVEPLVGAAREAALALVAAGDAVFAHLTEGSLELLNTTLDDVVKLQPLLKTQLTACRREYGDDVGQGRFHSWMTTIVAGIGDKDITWRLDAATTLLAAQFVRDRKAWASYRNHIVNGRKDPTFKRFVAYQGRYKKGHYNGLGELTDAGKAFDRAEAAKQHKLLTKVLPKYEAMDWSGFFDKNDDNETLLVKYGELAYFFTSRATTLIDTLSKTPSGKETVKRANDKIAETIHVVIK